MRRSHAEKSSTNLVRAIFLVLSAFACLVSCTKINPDHCANDQQCQDKTQSKFSAGTPYCHPEYSFCYSGCQSDGDCQNPSADGYNPDTPKCNLATHKCQASGGGGSTDGGLIKDVVDNYDGPPKTLGQSCGKGSSCQSGFCVDGVCCEKSACSTCYTCNATTKKGTCQVAPAGKAPDGHCPGDESCGAGQCNGQGQCAYKNAGSSCSASCSGNVLSSGNCSQSHTCSVTTSQNCPNNTMCNPDTNNCYLGCITHDHCIATSACDRTLAHQNGAGVCVNPSRIINVSPPTEIADQIGSTSTSKDVIVVAPGFYYKNMLIPSDRKVLIIGKSTSTSPVTLDTSTATNVSSIRLSQGSVMGIQGLIIKSSPQSAALCNPGYSSTRASSLSIIESTLSNNAIYGLYGNYCNITLRRNIISGNSSGGVYVQNGTFILDNNLIINNGSTNPAIGSTPIGGLLITNSNAGSLFINNTVVNNQAPSPYSGGVQCVSTNNMTLLNSIIWGNTNEQLDSACIAQYSDIEDGFNGQGNIQDDPQFIDSAAGNYQLSAGSPCLNSGLNSSSLSAIDLNSKTRVINSVVDIGAYEKQ